jgi:cell division protein ZapA (FtsZ GTPase activity inhibitor)
MGDRVQIRLLGTSFSIQTDQHPEYVESLVAYLEDKIRLVGGSSGTKDQLKTVILAALLVSDELFQLRSTTRATEPPGQEREIEALALSLIHRIDAVLEGEPPDRKSRK